MKTLVISLGGSVMMPDEVNYKFLNKFRKMLRKNYKDYKFVVVCGGGGIARKYISALKEAHKTKEQLSIAGMRATRMNALFLMQFFGKEANDFLPLDMTSVKNGLYKNNLVICGALRFANDSTSDGTAAKLASSLKCDFLNITNVSGLFSADPNKDKNARFIENISWHKFNDIALKIGFIAGQHFVLDQKAAKIIMKSKIRTIIMGPNVRNINKLIRGKRFLGTTIEG